MFRLLICRLKKIDIIKEASSLEEIEQIVEQDVVSLSEEEKDYRFYVAREIICGEIEGTWPIVYGRLIHQGGDSKDWADQKKF